MKKEKPTEEKAYKEILDVLNKYREICVYDVNEMESLANNHLFGIELKETYGFNIDPKKIQSLGWTKFNDYVSIAPWGKKYNREISFSDDGKQPEDEWLLQISFSTGPYIFGSCSGDDYPAEFFQEFFQELKTYGPKFTDTANKCLYFSMQNAGKIFNEFPAILKKYYELNKIDAKERKVKKLKAELDKLQANL